MEMLAVVGVGVDMELLDIVHYYHYYRRAFNYLLLRLRVSTIQHDRLNGVILTTGSSDV